MKKRELYIWLVCITIGFVALLKLGTFWKWALVESIADETQLSLVAGILTRFPMLIIAVFLLHKFQFGKFNNLHGLKYSQNFQALLIPMVLIGAAFFSSLNTYASADAFLLIIFIIHTVLVALIEELTFRGMIMPLMLRLRHGRRSSVFMSVLLTAIIFGLLHYINLFKQPENFSGITSQVIFATVIGIFLGGLMLRTRHIIFPIAIHFLINFSFGNGDLKPDAAGVIRETSDTDGFDAGTLITLLLFLFIAAGGWYMTRRADKKYFLDQIDAEKRDLHID